MSAQPDRAILMTTTLVKPSWIRSEIVREILAMFASTMPIYEQMFAVARDINSRAGEDEAQRLGRIMHGAIRCASDEELCDITGLFAVMGNYPVNYYDLREKVSVESTAYRPITQDEIEENGFRIFCSRLSMDCIPAEHRDYVQSIIARRKLFSPELLSLIDTSKANGGLNEHQARQFIAASVKLFTRPEESLTSRAEFAKLQSINKVACQVLVSNSLAFNHLTPSVASVPAAHEEMQRRGIKTIPVWQGPVGKDFILRQTSCLAPPVKLKFPNGDGTFEIAEYQETFVEFEERLQALTPKGRERFEALFDEGKDALKLKESDPGYAEHYYEVMREALSSFPSEMKTLWDEGLAYFTFEPTGMTAASEDINSLVASGAVKLVPQQYEDFFGPAATNIFNSNIGLEDVSNVGVAKPDSQAAFEKALGREVVNMYDYYQQIQDASREQVLSQLG
jgi:uncharacterized glyoxalase superfamily metalloenzyme YdcJ